MLFPHAFVIPLSREMSITQWHVPVDDTHCYWYAVFTSFAAPVDKATMRAQRLASCTLPDYAPRAGRDNDWGYDPEEQRTATYTGMGMDINVHDQWAVESMGAIQDRTQEHLGTSDRIIIAARRLFFRAIDDVAEGRDPPLTRDADAVHGPATIDAVGPADDLERYWREQETARRRATPWLAQANDDAALGRPEPLEPRSSSSTLGRAPASLSQPQISKRREQRFRRTARACGPRQQQDAAIEVAARIEKLGVVRFAFSDAHGVVRGKTLVAAEAVRALRSGVTCTLTMLLKDLSGRTAFPIFQPGGDGAGDMVMVADPCRFHVLPWAPHSGWILCDLYRTDGTPHPYSTRAVLRRMLHRLAEHGFTWRAGLEVEFHLLRYVDRSPAADHIMMPGPPPQVTPLNHGYQYLTEQRYDDLDPLLETLRGHLQGLGLPVRSLEVEFGPSQVEVTLGATTGMDPADQMLLFRNATKQIFAREGYLASFMCRPQFPHAASSGWHLHHSIEDAATGRNLFPDPDGLSSVARALAGWPVASRGGGGRVQHADDQWLQALPALLHGAGSCRVGL